MIAFKTNAVAIASPTPRQRRLRREAIQYPAAANTNHCTMTSIIDIGASHGVANSADTRA
jgi:hypothetical protein